MDKVASLNLETLRKALHAAEPAALLVEPRILRRVIRLDRRLPGLGLSVPHRKSYTIERDRLLAFVERPELELPSSADLPRTVILLSKPVEDEALDQGSGDEPLRRYWRLLFHACVHVALEARLEEHPAPQAAAAQRREEIGAVEFAEIRTVLLKDDFLFPDPNELETYVEFAAVYLELRYFAEHELPLYFPAIRDWGAIDRLVSRDVDHAQLFVQTRLGHAADPGAAGDETDASGEAAALDAGTAQAVSPLTFRKLQVRAERAAAVGNGVKAAIWQTRAALAAPPELADQARVAAEEELQKLVGRLQTVLDLSDDEAHHWRTALRPLLAPAAQGYWSNEARLLYDLQKVCVEHERGVYKLDLIEWLRTLGRRPVRRPLPLLREVLMTRRLRTANRRVATARMGIGDRQRLATLLAAAVEHVECRSRDRIRPLIVEALDDVGLVPQNAPERTARRKLVEELLDRLVDHGYLSMGDLRDALSKNDLKLPDVASVGELIFGDRLLRADRKLDRTLDGVYRRGAIYLRWPQTLSSLAFGTGFGRFVTQYVAVPFGGAYLTLEFLRHVTAWLTGHGHHGHAEGAQAAEPTWAFFASVFLLGVWLSLLMHRPAFREWNLAVLARGWQLGRQVLVELPTRVLHSQLVQRILNSQIYAAVQSYLLRPALVTALLALPSYLAHRPWSWRLATDVFLASALFLNSPIGRYATEVTVEFLRRLWHELRMRVFAAVFQWIMDLFHGLMVALERLVYTVDEWLRFRAGDNRLSQAVKLVAGVAWFFVAYVIVFAFTLLVEPQVNPIKHFPVVTVSHKVLLPLAWAPPKKFDTDPSPFAETLRRIFPLSIKQANWTAWAIVWGIPGMFGFLVWELKENWRLYAANRPPQLRPVAIGRHGETMVRLLRPGFHSGTLPKAFAALRRAARKAEKTGDWKPVNRKYAAVEHAEEAVRRFVERDLVGLLEETGFAPPGALAVSEVRVATNRVDVEVRRADRPGSAAWLTWEEDAGTLTACVSRRGWLDDLDSHERETFGMALVGLFQRSGVEETIDPDEISPATPVAWDQWVAVWSPETSPPSAPLASRAG